MSICNRNRVITGFRFLSRVTRRLDLAAEIYHLKEPRKISLVMSAAFLASCDLYDRNLRVMNSKGACESPSRPRPASRQVGRIHISEFRNPARPQLRNAAGPYMCGSIASVLQRFNMSLFLASLGQRSRSPTCHYRPWLWGQDASSWRSAMASLRSCVSKPSVNQP